MDKQTKKQTGRAHTPGSDRMTGELKSENEEES